MTIYKPWQLFIGVLIACTALFIVASAANAASYTVTKTADTNDGTCDTDCSLREAVVAANANSGDDVITLPAGTYTITRVGIDGTAVNGDLDITDTTGSLTINGNAASDTIVDANRSATSDWAFQVLASAELILNDITVTNGQGGIKVQSAGILTVNDGIVRNNTNATAGGGISSTTGNVTLSDSVIRDNSSSTDGGGIYQTSGGTLTITNSTISGNAAGSVQYGGGIYAREATMSISGSSITGNSAGDAGGILSQCGASNSTATITNSTISGNTALDSSGDGGGLYGKCSVIGTKTNVVYISHSTISGNTANDLGGGIYNTQGGDDTSTFEIKNSILGNNTANSVADDNCDNTGTITSNDNNIDSGTTCGFAGGSDQNSTDPLLDTAGLEDNGGDTNTISLQATSLAIDAGTCTDNSSATVSTDQRGLIRPEGSTCDIGAYELDQTDPVITITGDNPASHECATTYTDAGATANDNFDGSLAVISDTSAVDENTSGSYSVAYSATDNDANEGTATRTVNVVDTTDPTVTVTGDASVEVKQNDTYTDAGATASDTCDTIVTGVSTASIDNPVDTRVVGTYIVTYTATDASNNAASATRTVEVVSRGDATTLTRKKNNKVKVTYEDGSSQTFIVFTKGKAKPKVKFSKNKKRIVAINKVGKKLRVLDATLGDILAKKKLRKKKQKRAKLKVFNYYPKNAKNEIIVTTKKKMKLKTTIVTLTKGSKLKNKKTKTHEPFTKKNWKVKKKKKTLRLKTKKGKLIVKYKVTKKGNLVQL